MRESLRDRVAIVGAGCSAFGENWTMSAEDMIVEAAFEAYADAGLENPQQQLDAVFCGALYPSRGTAEVAESLKLFDLPITLVQNYCATGTDAFRCAAQSDGTAALILAPRTGLAEGRIGDAGPESAVRSGLRLPRTRVSCRCVRSTPGSSRPVPSKTSATLKARSRMRLR